MKSLQIRHHIDSIILYLEQHLALINCHMVNYFTEDQWQNFIPEEIRNYVINKNTQSVIQNTFWNQNYDSSNPVGNFFNSCKVFWLENLKNVTIDVEEFYQNINLNTPIDYLSVKGFMGEKKLHEVEITSELIFNLLKYLKIENTYIVDAGDGKGYLSSRLALQYQLKVLGVDSSEVNSQSATERNRKLQRTWKSLIERGKMIKRQPPIIGIENKNQNSQNIDEQGNISQNYKTYTKFISSNIDFEAIIKEKFNLDITKNINICLIGLHTCGNLASTCVKVFKDKDCIKLMCNIGCCYHLINEVFSKDDFFANRNISAKNIEFGFPLSHYLRNKNFKLGRNARMLSSQSIHKTCSKKDLPEKSLFYRALLEQIITFENPHLKNLVQVGKIKKFSNFFEYFKKCEERLNLNFSHLSEEHLTSMEKKFSKEESKLHLFYLLRMCMAPIVESLILLDRLLFLYEENFEETFLIKLFDPVISPRCYAIISIKK